MKDYTEAPFPHAPPPAAPPPAVPAQAPPPVSTVTGSPFAVPVMAIPLPLAAGTPVAEMPVLPPGPVKITVSALPAPAKVGDENIAPTTTKAEDATRASIQLRDLIREAIQSLIALSVVITTLYVSSNLALLIAAGDSTEKQAAMSITAFMLISNLVSFVIGFYFSRGNHQRVSAGGSGELGR